MRYYFYITDGVYNGYTVVDKEITDIYYVEKSYEEFIKELKEMDIEYVAPKDRVDILVEEKAELEMALIELAKKQSEENEYRTQLEVALVELAAKVGGE
ncbi:hypothetical protein KPL28_03380 [Clostridium algidicarnis]|uniref:hypothetical protein n=1 Tax=Clostridium algidicarnis TaxID=37659 RepID=UPI001C0D92EC|nr:hypothetical protein [Clostridium algidicarnis]MBU3208678.1 hypothetical protein [Clostridium algidicarnis]